MAHDKVVAVDEGFNLPAPVVDTLLGSTKFAEASGTQINTLDSPANIALKTLIESEVTDPENPVNDRLMVQIQADIGVEGGISRASIRSLINVLSIPDQIFIPANQFNLQTGTPVIAPWPTTGFPVGWLLDAATTEEMSTVVSALPPGWLTYEVFVVWTPTTAAAGNIMWRTIRYDMIQSFPPNQNPQTSTAIAANLGSGVGNLREDVIQSAVVRVSGPLVFRVARVGGDASDTYAADVAFAGLRLVRSS